MWMIIIVLGAPILADFVLVQRKDENNRASSQIWFADAQLKDYLNKEDVPTYKKVETVVLAPVFNYLEQMNIEKMWGNGLDLYEKSHSLEFGWFYIASLPMLIFGLIKGKSLYGKNFGWIVLWLLICPIIPGLTSGGVSAVRNLSMLVPVTILMAGGGVWLYKNHKKIFLLLMGLMVFEFFIFSRSYYIQFPKYSADGFQYGYKQAWEYIKPIADKYDNIVIEPKFGIYGQYIGVPHLYFGYFKAFPVESMQKRDDANGLHIDKFYFKEIDWNRETLKPKSIYVVSVINPRAGAGYDRLKLLTTIQKPNGQDQFLIYEVSE